MLVKFYRNQEENGFSDLKLVYYHKDSRKVLKQVDLEILNDKRAESLCFRETIELLFSDPDKSIRYDEENETLSLVLKEQRREGLWYVV